MTAILFMVYVGFYTAVVWAVLTVIGFFPGILTTAAIAALLFAIFYFVVFAQGAKIVLGVVGARELKKEEYPYVWHITEALSIGAGIPKPKVYVIDSPALNAFATGLDPKNSYIALTTGIIEKMNRVELEGVIAHEISHIRNYDIKTMLTAAVLAMAIAFAADVGLRLLRTRRGDRDKGTGVLLLLALALLILAPLVSLLIRLAISRNREYAADASAAMLTRYPPGLASALEKIKIEYEKNPIEIRGVNDSTRHLFIFDPMAKSLLTLFSTHPPIEDRIARLKRM